MTKFNVGDKVRFIEDYMDYKKGDIVEVKGFWSEGINYIGEGNSKGCYFSRVELVETKPTKNQRITALENEVAELRPLKQEVAELKLIVHELRDKKSIEPSTTNTVEDIIEFEGKQYRKVDREAREGDVVVFRNQTNNHIPKNNTPYLMDDDECIEIDTNECCVYSEIHNRNSETVDVFELIKSQPLTPNQQRAAIIEKAKKFVEENSISKTDAKTNKYVCIKSCKTYIEFVVNTEKHTIVALAKGLAIHHVVTRGIAKCVPGDVFNEHIGKAIALGQALGLDVSEFEQAVQPTFQVGQIIEFMSVRDGLLTSQLIQVKSNQLWFVNVDGDEVYVTTDRELGTPKIINDTNAIYEEGQ